jgi:hypothetical protein
LRIFNKALYDDSKKNQEHLTKDDGDGTADDGDGLEKRLFPCMS